MMSLDHSDWWSPNVWQSDYERGIGCEVMHPALQWMGRWISEKLHEGLEELFLLQRRGGMPLAIESPHVYQGLLRKG